MNTDTPTTREKFEEWAESQAYSLNRAAYAFEIYECAITREAWESWQAASKELAAVTGRLKEARERLDEYARDMVMVSSRNTAVTEQLKDWKGSGFKIAHILINAECKSDGIIDGVNELIEQRDRLKSFLAIMISESQKSIGWKNTEIEREALTYLQSINQPHHEHNTDTED